MDLENECIDPSWWEDVLASAAVEEYGLPELMSSNLQQAAQADGVGGCQQRVLEVLAKVTSAMLNPDDWLAPFTPAMQFDQKRSVVPADLEKEELRLLARIAPLVKRDDLRARVADVAWWYGDRANVGMLDAAIDGYRAAPLTDDVWFSVGKDAWRRAFELVNRRGKDGATRSQEMAQQLKAHVLGNTVADQFRVVTCAEVLRLNGRLGADERAGVAQALFGLAAQAKPVNSRLSRHLEREAVAWLGGGDVAAAQAAMERIGRTYIDEADARVKTDPKAGALVEGHFLEKAVATFRTLPRSYRVESGLEEYVEELRARLQASREMALEAMMRIESDPVDLTDAVAYARGQVSGHADRFNALAAFATLVPPMKADTTRENAEKVVAGSFSHIFGSSTFSRDGRKVAASAGSGGQPEDAVWTEMVRTVSYHALLLAQGMIQPAQELLTFEHRYSRDYMVSLCSESPVVPEGHATLWGAGLAFGMGGDYGPAAAVLVPQLEQLVRTLLKRNGAHTLYVDEQTGVEREKSLNALLDMDETADAFGAGLVLEMKALLVVQGAANMRNDIAHGLIDDTGAWSYNSLYMWWFCLRLVMLPVIQMMEGAAATPPTEATATDGDQSAYVGTDEPETVEKEK